jgi:hypothetical protein
MNGIQIIQTLNKGALVYMYCRNCGKELIGEPYYCLNCGARPMAGKSFCFNCANPTTALSEICVKCGRLLVATPTAVSAIKVQKSKTTSLLLAVFLSFWTWLYTYKMDNWKFWTGAGIVMFCLLLIGADVEWSWVGIPGVWVWSIIDVSLKNPDWYMQYK